MRKKDCSGLACPQPVLIAKGLIEEDPCSPIEIVVDNEAARQNVSRFLKSQGWEVDVSEKPGDRFLIRGKPGTCALELEKSQGDTERILIFIPADTIGTGNDELGRALMKNFIGTLGEMGKDLWRIVLVNGGVKLTVEGSNCLDALRALERQGVQILVCGTCLEFFGLLKEKAVGETTNMLDIVTSLQLASKVIRI